MLSAAVTVTTSRDISAPMPVTRLAQGHRLAALDALAAQVSTEEHNFVPTNPASVDAHHRLVRLRLPKGGLPYRNETVAYLIDDEPRARFGPAQVPIELEC